MQLPRRSSPPPARSSGATVAVRVAARVAVVSQPIRPARPLLGFGLAYGAIGGLLSALNVVGVALAIALNQQQIMRYTNEYTTYQQCLRENSTPAFCQAPTAGVLTVSVVWLLFIGASLLTFVLTQFGYATAARAVAVRTGSRSAGMSAAMLAASVGWLLYLVASVVAVFAQASPLTMLAPPPGVDTSAVHLGTAIGNVLFDALTLLPTVLVAMLVGRIAARRALRAFRRVGLTKTASAELLAPSSPAPSSLSPAAYTHPALPPGHPSLPPAPLTHPSLPPARVLPSDDPHAGSRSEGRQARRAEAARSDSAVGV